MTEKELHGQIVKLLRAHRIPFGNARMDRRSTLAVGYPDFTFPFRGRFVAWEAKVGKNDLTPEQEAFRDMIVAQGGAYRVIRNFEDAQSHLYQLL
jgi:hypothetical protein